MNVQSGHIISLKDNGDCFISEIKNKISGKRLYVLSISNADALTPQIDCRLKLLIKPLTARGKAYIWSPTIKAIGIENIFVHGVFDVKDLDENLVKTAKRI